MSLREELRPGSPEPHDPADVDRLLTAVPELVFMEPLAACVPTTKADRPSTHTEVDALFDETRRAAVVNALRELEHRAHQENNGGLAFIVRAMLHFAVEEPVAPSAHPLFVALFLRAENRASQSEDSARAIALRMDKWT